MQAALLLAATFVATPLVAGTEPTLPDGRLPFFVHDDRNASDTSTCARTAPSQATCQTGDFFCYVHPFPFGSFHCSSGFHSVEPGAAVEHGVPQDCCPGYRGRIRSVISHSGGESVVQCDLSYLNITTIRNCVGPTGPPPPPSTGVYGVRHSCTSTNFLSGGGTGSGTWKCFITHP